MGLFGNQLANVIEWSEYNDDTLFWKWSNNEIKKGSKLILKPGQDAIFLYNGKIEGVFEDDGEYDIQSDIIPFLSTLKGFKFGFNSGLRAEVIFINTKELTLKWGTKNAINIPAAGLPGGMPIRAFGTMSCKVDDYQILIEKISGVQRQYNIEDIKERVMSMLDQLLMKWIVREGKDMFNLQANAHEISSGIQSDLDLEMRKIGLSVTNFAVSSFNYPEEIKKMQEKAAAQSMVGDVNRYTQMAMADSMANGNTSGVASDMAQMQMGMMMGQQMVNQMGGAQQSNSNTSNGNENVPKFCPNCGTKTNGAKFCPECGTKLI
ncbi:SPFH domain-containing protein [Leptotrichia sp.]|uniref:SPFH domain-containing protein n=1 Tax=Leptotrichia sp. TaxID=104608 RepID=UPI00181CED02|nr:SPFH domain-containing protein [Leptotrichia sp.]MBB1534385.1 SPFH domain-containing protein [Leptotrichia sp.]